MGERLINRLLKLTPIKKGHPRFGGPFAIPIICNARQSDLADLFQDLDLSTGPLIGQTEAR